VNPSSPQPERRRHRRLELAFPVRFSTRSRSGAKAQGQGLTVDISSGGVRFETDAAEAPQPQTDLAVYITIPRREDDAKSSVFLSGTATVVRCEPADPETRRHTGARWCVAARFEGHPDISLPFVEDFPGRS
jgi:hypothetical protein